MPAPPVVVAVAEPLHNPKHVAFTPAAVALRTKGWVMITAAVSVQPLPSVIVAIKLPAQSPVAEEPVWTGEVFHE